MHPRQGLTLLEVILALTIFVASLALVSKLVELGVRGSQYTQLQTRAVLLAESKMAEFVAGVTPLSGQGGDTFPEDPAWQWQMSVSDGVVGGLKWVSLTVSPAASGELASNRERIDFTLSRWVLDPAYSSELDSSAASNTGSGTSGSGTSGTGSGTSASSGTSSSGTSSTGTTGR